MPPEVSRGDLLTSAAWRFLARRLRRGDRIVWADDYFLRAGELMVVSVDIATGNTELRELSYKELAPVTQTETEVGGFDVKDLGAFDGFAIVRLADKQIVEKNIPSKDEAWRRVGTSHVPNNLSQGAAGTLVR